MVNNTINNYEEETRKAILKEIKATPRGISITGLVKSCKVISRSRIRTALAYLLGAGKIEESRASMAKLYYAI